jgi:hypothetical protein
MGGSEQRPLDDLFRVSRNYSLLRFKDERLYDHYVRAAAQAIVA